MSTCKHYDKNLSSSQIIKIDGTMKSDYQTSLLRWYDKHGRQTLPWRHNISGYRTWLSEVMLQQTQVKTVLPYFERFIEHYPTIDKLAGAKRDSILALWSGLGYYSRAKNLHLTAKIIASEHQSLFPECSKTLQSLPGIGESTAHAILAITYDRPFAILDGNVKRVLSRLCLIDGAINQTNTIKRLWAVSKELVPDIRPRDYTQAIMDLGATLCTRTKPRCCECPIHHICQAHQTKQTDLYPFKAKRKALLTKKAHYSFIINDQNQILLKRRPDKGLWAGLWQCPEVPFSNQEVIFSLKHSFTHFHLEMSFERGAHLNRPTNPSECYFGREALKHIGLPKPFSVLIDKYFENPSSF